MAIHVHIGQKFHPNGPNKGLVWPLINDFKETSICKIMANNRLPKALKFATLYFQGEYLI
jgi:hypothetical protein